MNQVYQHFAESHNIDPNDNGVIHSGCFKTLKEAREFLTKHNGYVAQSSTSSRMGVSPYGEWSQGFDVDAYFDRMVVA